VIDRARIGSNERHPPMQESEGHVSHSPTTLPRFVTQADLEHDGFTTAQITRLEQLRVVYPFVEFTDSADEWRRLTFIKWCHTNGRING
jgi:hypothetical protein